MTDSNKLSATNREKTVNTVSESEFDILIFGGGITGAGIALDAVSRGLKTLLIEKNDFAFGTSSRSTKLVHGGLRYLEKLQFSFVAKLGKERKILHDNITHNVIPTRVVLPIIAGGKLNRILTFFALKIYDTLAGVKKEYSSAWIKKELLLKKYPFLKEKKLKGGFLYYEYKTNDARLVIEILKTAGKYGVKILNYNSLANLTYSNSKVNGAEIFDSILQKKYTVKAKYVINATGPWCENFANKFDTGLSKSLFPTKGVHIVVSKQKFPVTDAFYFDTHDKRMIFIIPRQNYVYIGTTDTPFFDDLNNPLVENKDAEYLLKAVNNTFTQINLKIQDIISCWAGVRPLISNKGKSPDEISRKDEMFISKTGLISITGGKLTGYRLMAKKVVDNILKKENNFLKCHTDKIKISGSKWKQSPELVKLVETADYKFDEAKQTGILAEDFKKLFYRYGTNIDIVTEKAYELLSVYKNPHLLWLKAEIWYSINYEMTSTIADFCIYRTEMILFEPEKIEKYLYFIVECMTEFLQWSSDEQQKNIEEFKKLQNQYKIAL
jgi:glycerol-3-phosphate dehydrogenase